MGSVLPIVNVALPALYAGLVARYAWLLFRDPDRDRPAGSRLLPVTVAIHFLFIVATGIQRDRHPVANKFEMFAVVAFGIALATLWVERRRRNPYTGAFPLALALLLQTCASLGWSLVGGIPEVLRDPLFAWHTGFAALAISAFSVGAVYGGLYLLLYRMLKRGRLVRFTMRMPSLDVMARMTLHAAELGVGALTVAIVLGAAWAARTPDASMADPKVIATLVAWALYGLALGGHWRGWGGWRTVALSLAGYATLLGSILVVGRLFDSFHRFTG